MDWASCLVSSVWLLAGCAQPLNEDGFDVVMFSGLESRRNCNADVFLAPAPEVMSAACWLPESIEPIGRIRGVECRERPHLSGTYPIRYAVWYTEENGLQVVATLYFEACVISYNLEPR